MTIAGNVFRGYAEAITEKHGFGSNKMVAETENKVMMAILRTLYDFDRAACMKVGEAQRWLLDNGYLRKYEASWESKYRHKYATTHCRDYIGLTAKGWAIAKKYMETEEG